MLLRALALAALVAAGVAAPARAAERSPQRIVSLMPSLTEDLFALGAGSRVVAVSAYADAPSTARRLPEVATATSVATERIVALRPDLVVGIPAQAAQTADLRRAGIRVVLLRDDSFEDLFADLRALGALTAREAEARRLIARLRARTAAIARETGRGPRPAVLVVLSDAPIYTAGRSSYIAELIRLAGGRNAADDLRFAYGTYSAEAVLAAQPDVVLVDPQASLDLARAPWNALRAVRAGHVRRVPASVPLYRPGPRYNDALAWLVRTFREARS